MSIVRFGISFEKELLEMLDKYTSGNHFCSRSQGIRNLISKNIVTTKWQNNGLVDRSITLVYDHHKKDMMNQLTDLQHDYRYTILSFLHFHLEKDSCMEIIAMKGNAVTLIELADKLIDIKVIQHGKQTMSRSD